MPRIWSALLLIALTLVAPGITVAQPPQDAEGDPQILARMQLMNRQLASLGFNFAVGQIELYTVGAGRSINRIIKDGFRFVPNDPRRNADGTNIRYLVDSTADTPVRGDTSSGLTHFQTEAAIDRAMATWAQQQCLRKVNIVKRFVPNGVDPDLFDFFIAGDGHPPSQFSPFQADIIHGGFITLSPPFPPNVIAVTCTVYFVQNGKPTDINHDGYADTVWTETYYSDAFGWSIGGQLPSIDVETVALHESGHAFGLGHFGPPPDAVMNPSYTGIRQTPLSTDSAGICSVWSSWPQN